MGTTAVAAVVRGRELYVANVGDSRAYLLRNGKLTQVTRDHSFVQEQIEAGILTPEEARTHPQRNVVTRALGSKPDVQVDTFGGKLEPGDTLLLCTDGLSEHVEDETIAAMLSQYHPREAVPRLIALANQRGGSDNISALVVQIGSAAGTTAVAGAVPAGQAVPAAPSRPTRPREGLSLPLIAGLSAGGLILVAALVVGLVFFGPRFLWGDAEETSQPPAQSIIATATLLSPSPTEPPATATLRSSSQSLTPESTSAGSAGAPTSTPRVGLTLLEPDDRAIVPPDARVPFRWEVSGTLPDPFNFVVKTHQSGYEELCGGSSMSCGFRLAVGEYQWWVELWSGNTMMLRSEARTLSVRPPTPTPSPTSTFTPVPPTNTPRPSGGGGGGNGGDTTKPTKTPSVPSAMPTDTKETPEPPGGGG
jgi:protein phosphatase